MAYRLGVDVGGTFTDLFLVSEGDGGAQFRVKTPSTPGDPSEGVLTGVRRICDEAGIGVGELQNFLHGTTVATNAVLESKGARVGLITTQGFGQILHLARSQTPGPSTNREPEPQRERRCRSGRPNRERWQPAPGSPAQSPPRCPLGSTVLSSSRRHPAAARTRTPPLHCRPRGQRAAARPSWSSWARWWAPAGCRTGACAVCVSAGSMWSARRPPGRRGEPPARHSR